MYGDLFSDLHRSKGLKLSSSTAPVRPSSNLMNINIDDLPEAVLLEILSRLPSYRYVSQCKCVSKRWCTLMSDRSFICSFISLQRDSDQMVRTLINKDGREFLTRMSSSLDALAPLFQRLMKFHRLEKEPVVLGAYNDLVLCCASYTYQRDYYICNPCTYQWLPLPPPPQVHKWTPVGFICDVPYYQCKEGDNDQKGKFIQVNTEYRGRVVRLITICQGKFNVQIFSTETGEWTESIVSFPSLGFGFVTDIRPNMSFPYNGMLYWMGYSSEFIIGLDPFMITDRNNTSLPSNTPGYEYKFRFIKIDRPGHGDDIIDDLYCLGEHRGSLQFYTYNITKAIITVYQLNKEATLEGAGKFCLQDGWMEYELDWEILPDEDEHVSALAFDPNSDGSLYLQRATYRVTSAPHADIFMYNQRKGWSIIAENIPSPKNNGYNEDYHQVALPCWPTPIPRQHASTVRSHPSEFQAPSHSINSTSKSVRPSSNLMNINIDDLPEAVLLEILSRLPSYRYVSQCKCVSKRWCTLMSDPSFICSFISLQRDSDQMVRTLINKDGREFLTRMSSSLDALGPLFQRLMRFHRLEKEPVVLGAYNDLVLCCASYTYQRDYYICNPCTYQWLPLPPPPQVHKWTPVGFICNVPYYQCKEGDNDQKGKFIQVNTEYRGRVVRLITICQGKFNVQIFSTETGEWTESIVSFPSLGFGFVTDIRPNMSFPYNGMLYWMGYSSEFIIGLDPFMITDRDNTSLPSNTPGDEYKFRFIKIDRPGHGDDIIDDLYCLGEHRGSLQFYTYNITKAIITVYQLNKEATLEGAGKICLQDGWVEYELDWEILPDEDEHILALAFDPNSDGSLYLQRATYQVTSARHADIFMYNKRKGWSIIAENIPSPKNNGYNKDYHQVALPCWPTPVPRQHASTVSSHPSQFQAPSHSS